MDGRVRSLTRSSDSNAAQARNAVEVAVEREDGKAVSDCGRTNPKIVGVDLPASVGERGGSACVRSCHAEVDRQRRKRAPWSSSAAVTTDTAHSSPATRTSSRLTRSRSVAMRTDVSIRTAKRAVG